jgi:asparagine synthase (glutamine-hydrolysing)
MAWLRSPYRDEVITDIARLTTHEPWSWADALRSHLRLPALELALANRDWFGSAYGVQFVHPLLDPRFVDAVARHGGPLGYAGRTDAMRRLFGDLLPDAILARATKVAFNTAVHGQATRAFAQSWDGTGFDPAVVNIDVLRSMWLAARVHAGTDALLQKAWLASGCPPVETSTLE